MFIIAGDTESQAGHGHSPGVREGTLERMTFYLETLKNSNEVSARIRLF